LLFCFNLLQLTNRKYDYESLRIVLEVKQCIMQPCEAVGNIRSVPSSKTGESGLEHPFRFRFNQIFISTVDKLQDTSQTIARTDDEGTEGKRLKMRTGYRDRPPARWIVRAVDEI